MSKTITIHRTTEDGKVESKKIHELLEEDNDRYNMLGKAIGINMGHCVMLGLKHNKYFWDRVYGYKIIQNDKIKKAMFKSMGEIEPKIKFKSYIAVSFYELRTQENICSVPKRLQIPDHPELSNFPINIVFGNIRIAENNTRGIETAEYLPDFSTFTEEKETQKMRYYNRLNSTRRYCVEVIYNTTNQSYFGVKYRDDKNIGMAYGKNWDMFFIHLTALGVGS